MKEMCTQMAQILSLATSAESGKCNLQYKTMCCMNPWCMCDLIIFPFFSECLDGEVICFEDFVPDVEGRLNSSQLNKLSDLLKQFFYFETDLRDSIIHDIRKISAMISESKSLSSNSNNNNSYKLWS